MMCKLCEKIFKRPRGSKSKLCDPCWYKSRCGYYGKFKEFKKLKNEI
jgi:hypothetical protein